MNRIPLLLTSLFGVAAHASTIILLPLAPVPPLPVNNVHWEYCTGNGFSGNTVVGVCKYSYGAGYHSNPTVLYHVSWNFSGHVVLGAQCLPADNCALNFGNAPLVQVGPAWYYYVTTASNGGHEIVSAASRSYLVTF